VVAKQLVIFKACIYITFSRNIYDSYVCALHYDVKDYFILMPIRHGVLHH
jgi:hypothetical protein